MTTPLLRPLDLFAQMVASGSIAECARNLSLSPSAVKRQMQALEARMGHRLFEDDDGSVRLTAAGRKAIEAMQMLADAPAEVVVPAAAEPPIASKRQPVTIAAHPALFAHFQDALNAFEESSGDVAITLDLSVFTAAAAARLLASGQVDIAYIYTLGEPPFETRYVWSEPVALYAGESHWLAQADLVEAAMLAEAAPVMLLPGNGLRPLIDEALAQAGIVTAAAALETDNLFDIMTALREGVGYFAAFGPLARDIGRMEGIRRLPFVQPLPQIDLRQAVRADMRDDPVVASLAEYLFR